MSERDKTLQDKFVNIAFMDCSSPPDSAIFFSGPRAKRAAKADVARSGGERKTVLETEALNEFNKWQPLYFGQNAKFSISEAYFIGDCISESFARQASGKVTIYLDGIKPHGTFARAELPTLLSNPAITQFVVHDFGKVDLRAGQQPAGIVMDKEQLQSYINRHTEGMPDRRLGGARKGADAGAPTQALT